MAITITTPELPGVTFFGVDSLYENCEYALEIERVRKRLENAGDEHAYREAMTLLGFESEEVEEGIKDPKARQNVGYA